MRYVTVLGAGLLVGTALAVIIPEGVHALYMNDMSKEKTMKHIHNKPVRSACCNSSILETHDHDSHSEHQVIGRHLNQMNSEHKDNRNGLDSSHNDLLSKSSSENEHQHSTSTHSAIGR
jgi:hypothetical protein